MFYSFLSLLTLGHSAITGFYLPYPPPCLFYLFFFLIPLFWEMELKGKQSPFETAAGWINWDKQQPPLPSPALLFAAE